MTLGSEQIMEMADRLAEFILTLVRSGKLDHGDVLQVVTIASRLIRAGFPVGCEALAVCVREHLEDAAEAIEQLSRGRAVSDEVLVRLTRR